ncbi:MAG: ADP-ribosylglycohydrolase family protein [Terrimicrobiaceae bacterium]
MSLNIAIIGAGIAGVSAARALTARGCTLTLFEKARGESSGLCFSMNPRKANCVRTGMPCVQSIGLKITISGNITSMNTDTLAGLAWGSFIGDALAMPVHWYYDRAALHRDYGVVREYVAPKSPHADSILGRSEYTPLNERGDILHDQAQYWGQRGIHYHQFLRAGENTLNLQLAKVLIDSLIARGGYDADDYLERYIQVRILPPQPLQCSGSGY